MARPEDERLLEAIRKRRGDIEFMDRLRRRITEDAELLARLDVHVCRYPSENGAGFPVNQCLDCGGWFIAEPDTTPPPDGVDFGGPDA